MTERAKSSFAASDGPAGEWRAGGAMLFSAIVGASCLSMPIVVLGIMIKPLSDLYGWPRASITSAILFIAIGTLFLAPVVGHVVDRIGPRRVGLVGLILLSLATIGIGLSGPSIESWYIAWILFAVVQPIGGYVIWVNGVTGRFNRHLGLALGGMFLGSAIFTSILPPIGVAIMETFDWRGVYFALAAFMLVVAVPLVWYFFHGVRDLDRIEARQAAECQSGSTPRAAPLFGATVGEALRSRQFWQLCLASLLGSAGLATIYVHMQPILTDAGMSMAEAASVALIIGPAAMAGRFGSGYLVDRLPASTVSAAVLLFPAIGLLMLIGFDGSMPKALFIAVAGGVASGAEANLIAFLARRYFGLRSFSVIYAFLLGAYSIGYGIAPVLAGRVYDSTGSYGPIIWPLIGSCVVGGALLITLGPYPSFAEERA